MIKWRGPLSAWMQCVPRAGFSWVTQKLKVSKGLTLNPKAEGEEEEYC